MLLVELKTHDGGFVWINPNSVGAIEQMTGNETEAIVHTDSGRFHILGAPTAIYNFFRELPD